MSVADFTSELRTFEPEVLRFVRDLRDVDAFLLWATGVKPAGDRYSFSRKIKVTRP